MYRALFKDKINVVHFVLNSQLNDNFNISCQTFGGMMIHDLNPGL